MENPWGVSMEALRRGMMRATEHCYTVTDEQILNGEPIIKDTRTPAQAIVETWRLGILPEEIPSHCQTDQ
jgi:Uncharacterized conserved protein